MSYSAKNLSVFKGNKNIINEISFDFPSGSYVSIIGPNGAGKTTLLKTLAGLLNFKGSLLINNVDSDELFKYSNKNNCAYVPQNISIHEGMSLIENLLAKTNEFYDLIIQLKKDLKLTIFFSTHDINSISKYSEYVIVLKKGKKIFSGKINEILNEVFLSELYETKLNKIITEDGYPLFY